MTDLFITGTDTGAGKTTLSALLVAALGWRYWKPIQTGAVEGTDRERVIRWAGIAPEDTHAETYLFERPVSPHLAAEQKGMTIDLESIQRPQDPRPLIIEGAGGALVPISRNALMIDLMCRMNAPVLIASRTALGTINHTLLTIAAVRGAGLELRGVVMIGPPNDDNRRAIEDFGYAPVVGAIPWLDVVNRATLCGVFEREFKKNAFA